MRGKGGNLSEAIDCRSTAWKKKIFVNMAYSIVIIIKYVIELNIIK